jgi:hypothetical protein
MEFAALGQADGYLLLLCRQAHEQLREVRSWKKAVWR